MGGAEVTMNRTERHKVGQIQTIIGRALNGYLNDRASNRAEIVIDNLRQAFEIAVDLLGKYPPDDVGEAKHE